MNLLEMLTQAFIEDITSFKTVCTYVLIGVISSAFLEGNIRRVGIDVNWADRFWIVIGWPIALITFIYHFLKGLFGND